MPNIWRRLLRFFTRPAVPLRVARLPYGTCGQCGGPPDVICAQVGCPLER